ncbi:MAG: HD domain-containing protein [Planctomycetota bacterium]
MPSSAIRTPIAHLEAAQLLAGVYAIQNCQLGQTKAGKPYLKMLLADKTGRTPARMWNTTEQIFRSLPTDGFVYIEGQSQPYQGEMQIIVNQIRKHEPTPDELRELLPSTEQDVDQMFAEVVRILGTIEHPALACLRDRYFEDGPLMDAFCQAPAAQTLHHAYLGGLLEHTLSLLKGADALLPLYPGVNRDVVLMGLFLHDLGKCKELTWEQGFAYTTDGQLVGHIGRGVTILAEKAKACEDPELGEAAVALTPPLLTVLEHIILSHHGQPDFGALKIPATPEAIFISLLDNLDAKMNLTLGVVDRGGHAKSTELGGDFTEKVWALETRVYRPDPTQV